MSTSDRKRAAARLIIYVGVTALCAVFSTVYNGFSHGVFSFCMTYLFLFPLLLGVLPSIILLAVKYHPLPLAGNLYHTGVAALIVSACLRGVFEIAKISSDHRIWLSAAGIALIAAGVAVSVFCRKKKNFGGN